MTVIPRTPLHNTLFAWDIKPYRGWRKLLVWLIVWAVGCVFWTGLGYGAYSLFN